MNERLISWERLRGPLGRVFLVAFIGSAWPAPLLADPIGFPDFSTPGGQIALNGAAGLATDSLSRGVLRLTPDALDLAGSAWYVAKVPVVGGFTTSFTYRMSGSGSTQADGLAFVLQNDATGRAALGGIGGWLGYGYPGLHQTVAIEFDTYFNSIPGTVTADANGNHVAIHKSLGADAIDAVYVGNLVAADLNPGVTLNDGSDHLVNIAYTPGFFTVSLDGHPLFGGPVGVDLASVLGSDDAYVGFTAGTAAASQSHDIVNWQLNPVPEPASLLLLGTGLAVAGALKRRRR